MNDMTRLDMFDTPSRKWWVSYNGGISMGVGVYEFIFRGDESLTGAVVRLTGAGLSASWGIKKGGKLEAAGPASSPFQVEVEATKIVICWMSVRMQSITKMLSMIMSGCEITQHHGAI